MKSEQKGNDSIPDNVDWEAGYQKAEFDLLRDSLRSSYTERFLMATKLYKISKMLQNAKITHQPFINKG